MPPLSPPFPSSPTASARPSGGGRGSNIHACAAAGPPPTPPGPALPPLSPLPCGPGSAPPTPGCLLAPAAKPGWGASRSGPSSLSYKESNMDPLAKTPAPVEKQENVTALAEGMEQPPAEQDTTPAPVDVEVRSLGSGPVSVAGGVTGRTYVFHGHGAVLTVAAAARAGLGAP